MDVDFGLNTATAADPEDVVLVETVVACLETKPCFVVIDALCCRLCPANRAIPEEAIGSFEPRVVGAGLAGTGVIVDAVLECPAGFDRGFVAGRGKDRATGTD